MYVTKTLAGAFFTGSLFENDVKMYVTKTNVINKMCMLWFENDVKMYVTKTWSAYVA